MQLFYGLIWCLFFLCNFDDTQIFFFVEIKNETITFGLVKVDPMDEIHIANFFVFGFALFLFFYFIIQIYFHYSPSYRKRNKWNIHWKEFKFDSNSDKTLSNNLFIYFFFLEIRKTLYLRMVDNNSSESFIQTHKHINIYSLYRHMVSPYTYFPQVIDNFDMKWIYKW